jgi:DNA helicase-2/ATP-dependent DNA helicase PcrA
MEILSSRSELIGLPANLQIFESQNDRFEILRNAISHVPGAEERYLVGTSKEVRQKVSNLYDFISKVKKGVIDLEKTNKFGLERIILNEYDNLLIELNAIDYDDILRYTYKIFMERNKVLSQYSNIYRYIFVDEAQDIDRAQYNIISVLAKENQNLTLVGDSKQAIYSFNGASSVYFRERFVDDFNPKVVELTENYRSAKKIIEYAKKIKPNFNVSGVCKYTGEFEIFSHHNDVEEAKAIVDLIQNLVLNGHPDVEGKSIDLSQILVLARNRYVFDKLKNQLDINEISYTEKVSSQNSLASESDFMYSIEMLLKVIINANDTFHLDKVNKYLDEAITKDNIYEYQSNNPNTVFLLSLYEDIIVSEDKFDVNLLIQRIKTHIQSNIFDENELQLIFKDMENWLEQWNHYLKNSYRNRRCLSDFLRQISIGDTSQKDEDGIVLSTVHMAKGLEYDVVIIMGLNEGVFPDYRSLNSKLKLDEEENNFFVGITRAKRLCYITYPGKVSNRWGSFNKLPSRYISKLNK